MENTFSRVETALAEEYALEREIGSGGMAVVYLAEDRQYGRKVAIKVLRPELAASLGAERFVREIDISARLTHPHILTLLQSGDADGLLYYVMPYVEGESLRDRLLRESRLSIPDAIRITEQVAAALTYAHDCGVVHRDIKPENILLSRDQAVVADFGIARALEAAGGERLTETGLAIGTISYMSPEQALGDSGLDGRSDVYSLGCVAYEMIAGRRPFDGSTLQALLAQQILGKAKGLRVLDGDIPLYVERAIQCAMAREPSERFDSPTMFAETLASQTVIEAVGRRRLAVLPPINVTGDPEQDHLVLGLHESLISQLGQGDVAVLARSSVLHYQGTEKPLSEIARELGVDAVVESSLHRVGDTVAIQARLIDGATEEALWADSRDGPIADLFSLYRALAGSIANEIEVVLAPTSATRQAARRGISPAAYEAYMRGRVHQERMTPEDLAHALRYYEAALEAEPDYAPAHAGIALVWGTRIVLGVTPPLVGGPHWKEFALRAVELDPRLSEAHQALAQGYTWFDWEWELADAAFVKAIDLDPNDPQARTFYSHFLSMMKRPDEALAQGERAMELDPLNPFHRTMHGIVKLHMDRFADADSELAAALEISPNNALARWALGMSHFRQGRAVEAAGAMADFFALVGDQQLAELLREGEREDPALASMRGAEVLVERARDMFVKPEMISLLFDQGRDLDRAIEWIDKGYELRDHTLPYLAVYPYSDALRGDPRYKDLMRRVGLPVEG